MDEGVISRPRPMRKPMIRRPVYFAHATVVSCIPDVMHPFDPAVVRAIHEFDPRVMPVYVKKVYRAGDTGGFHTVGFHAIASHVPPTERHSPIQPWVYKTLMPTLGGVTRRPTQIDFYHADRGVGSLGWGYKPFDWRIYQILRSTYDEWSWKERKAYIDEHGEQAVYARAKAKAQAEVDYAHESDEAFLNKHTSQFDDDDVKRALAGPQPYEARPMVEVHAPKEEATA